MINGKMEGAILQHPQFGGNGALGTRYVTPDPVGARGPKPGELKKARAGVDSPRRDYGELSRISTPYQGLVSSRHWHVMMYDSTTVEETRS